MKKIIYAIILLYAIFSFQSCNKLDLYPEDYYAAGTYWKSEAQINNFMNGLHSNLRSALVAQVNMYGEFRGATLRGGTNICGTNTQYGNLVANLLDEDHPGISNWGGFYSRLLQVNHMISELEKGCEFLSDDSRGYYEGIAYGLRAYYYFWLYRSYGGVPLELEDKIVQGITNPTDLYMERASAEKVLARIKNDIETSLTAFEKTSKRSDFYHWSKNASLMLKAEVYLWSAKVTTDDPTEPHVATLNKSDLNSAKDALDKLSGYKLVDDFGWLFSHEGKNKTKNTETIFALYLDKDEFTYRDYFRTFFYHLNFNGVAVVDADGNDITDPLDLKGDGLIYNEYRQSLVESFDKKDSRRAATFCEYFAKEDGRFGCSMKKFFGQNANGLHYYDPDVILYRYADAVLMKAEIENALGNDCSTYINEIRKRAYGENYSDEVAYKKGTFEENEFAILKERDKEFVGEGKRWFDLLRLQNGAHQPLVFSVQAAYEDEGILHPVLEATESYKVLWPIEVSLINNDPLLKQTVNYPTRK